MENFFPQDIIYHLCNAAILFLIVRFLVHKPLVKFMKARAEELQATIDAAEQGRAETVLLQEAYEKQMAAADDTARARAMEIIKTANDSAKSLTENAQRDAQEILTRARSSAAETSSSALRGLRQEVANAAITIAEKILTKELESSDSLELADQYLEELQKAKGGDAA